MTLPCSFRALGTHCPSFEWKEIDSRDCAFVEAHLIAMLGLCYEPQKSFS